jgi:hypothetical protein
LKTKDGLELGDFLMGNEFGVVHTKVRVVILMEMRGDLFVEGILVDPERGRSDAGEGNPVVVAFVEVLKVDVV